MLDFVILVISVLFLVEIENVSPNKHWHSQIFTGILNFPNSQLPAYLFFIINTCDILKSGIKIRDSQPLNNKK